MLIPTRMEEDGEGGRQMNGRIDTETVWKEFQARLLSFIRGRVERPQDAEDLLQEVFTRIHARADSLGELESVSGWVYRVTRNAIIDHHRRRAAAERLSSSLRDPSIESDAEDDAPTAAREVSACLAPLMQTLTPSDREALQLTELEGLSQKSAAERLGLSTSGMKSKVQRGRVKLKQALLDCCHIELDRRRGVVDYTRRTDAGACSCGCPPRNA